MTAERYVVIGLAHPRVGWFAEVGRWANAGLVPIEFVRCVSAEEVAAHVRGRRLLSAALVDGAHRGLDRDLVGLLAAAGCPVVVVDPPSPRRLQSLGAAATLCTPFGQGDLADALERWASAAAPIVAATAGEVGPSDRPVDAAPPGHLIAVVGTTRPTRAVTTVAVAQGLASHRGAGETVVLADLALDSVQGVLHGAPDVSPGVSELVEAHRRDVVAPSEVVRMTFGDDRRGYRLLLGLRRRRDWTALRPRAVSAGLASLRCAASTVVAETDSDLDGEDECGSADVEERNVLARTAVDDADLVVVASTPDLLGVHGLVEVVTDLLQHGVPTARVQVLYLSGARSPAGRARLARTTAELIERGGAAPAIGLASPLHLDLGGRLEVALRDLRPLPTKPCAALGASLAARLDALPRRTRASQDQPVAVEPGSLGRWFDEAEDAAS